MKKLLIILGCIFVFGLLNAQSYYNSTNYYYADGIPQYWTDDSTSANIIVKNMHNYDAIAENLLVLFSDSTDEVLYDDEDDNK